MDSMPPEAKSKAITYWEKMGKLNLLTGLIGLNNHQKMTIENQKNQQAESAYIRREVWGETHKDMPESDDMGTQTILGDVTNPTPIVIAGNQSSGGDLLKTLAIAALGAAVPTAGLIGVAGYHMLNQQRPDPIVQPVLPDPELPDFSVGLGKIEDYLKE